MFYLVGGLRSVFHLVGGEFLVWAMVGCFYGQCGRWSVSNVVGGRCFAFLLAGGRFLFLRMVGGRCLNQYMVGVGGSWSVVCGLWSVAGRCAVVLYYANSEFKSPIFTLYEHSKSVTLELSCQLDESIRVRSNSRYVQ